MLFNETYITNLFVISNFVKTKNVHIENCDPGAKSKLNILISIKVADVTYNRGEKPFEAVCKCQTRQSLSHSMMPFFWYLQFLFSQHFYFRKSIDLNVSFCLNLRRKPQPISVCIDFLWLSGFSFSSKRKSVHKGCLDIKVGNANLYSGNEKI